MISVMRIILSLPKHLIIIKWGDINCLDQFLSVEVFLSFFLYSNFTSGKAVEMRKVKPASEKKQLDTHMQLTHFTRICHQIDITRNSWYNGLLHRLSVISSLSFLLRSYLIVLLSSFHAMHLWETLPEVAYTWCSIIHGRWHKILALQNLPLFWTIIQNN